MPLACCVHWVGHGQRKENEGKCNCMCQWTQRGELRSVISVSIHWNLSLSVSWTNRYHRFSSKVVYDFCSRALFLSLVDMHLGTSLWKTPSDFSSALRNLLRCVFWFHYSKWNGLTLKKQCIRGTDFLSVLFISTLLNINLLATFSCFLLDQILFS